MMFRKNFALCYENSKKLDNELCGGGESVEFSLLQKVVYVVTTYNFRVEHIL